MRDHWKLIFFLFVINFNKVVDFDKPFSSCPNIFQYRFDGFEWFGVVTLKNSALRRILHLKVILIVTGKTLNKQNYLGEIELLTRGQLLQNASIVYKVKFPQVSTLPRVLKIFVNNHLICLGHVAAFFMDQNVLVTIIHLEHTRRIFLPNSNDSSLNSENNESVKKSSSIQNNFTELHSLQKICGQTEFPEAEAKKSLHANEELLARGIWPWLSAIYLKGPGFLSYKCSGILISTRVVLSSARCFFSAEEKIILAKDLVVSLGRHNLLNWLEEKSVIMECDEIFIHPDCDINSYNAEVAAIILEKSVEFNEYIRPVCLWTGSPSLELIEGEHGNIISWCYDKTCTISSTPKKITATLISQSICLNSNDTLRSFISNRTFCTTEGSESTLCYRDFGAAVIISRNDKWSLRGIFSASLPFSNNKNMCNLSKFSLYTDVVQFLDWILILI